MKPFKTMPIMPDQWAAVDHFDPSEKWGDPSRMDFDLILQLDRLRSFIDSKIIIHCGFEPRDSGFHPLGLAVDCHAVNIHPVKFLLAAIRFRFGGIGLYTWWENPGLHLDTRPVNDISYRAMWGSPAPKVYVPLDRKFLSEAMSIQTGGE